MQVINEIKYLALGYHKIVSSSRPKCEDIVLAINTEQFRNHLNLLKLVRYKFVTISELVQLRKIKASGRYVAITFDDGSKDLINHAFPIIQELGGVATVYAATDFVPGSSFFPWDMEWAENGKMILAEEDRSMSWDELLLLQKHGWEIGSHTLSHPLLTEIPIQEAINEIVMSKKILEDKLKRQVKSFCYPARYSNLEVARAVEAAGYKCAVISFPSFPLPNGKKCPSYGDFTVRRVGLYRPDKGLRYIEKITCLYEFVQWIRSFRQSR